MFFGKLSSYIHALAFRLPLLLLRSVRDGTDESVGREDLRNGRVGGEGWGGAVTEGARR